MFTFQTLTFSRTTVFAMCFLLGVYSNTKSNAEKGDLKKVDPMDLPESSDIQILTEGLWFNKVKTCPWIEDFRYWKLKAVDVCKLSRPEAMKYCTKLQRMYNLTEGNYSLIPGGTVAECKPYHVVFYHTGPRPTYVQLKVRKCPFQPDELFLASGNKRMSVFALTWTNVHKKYLLLDHYIDDDDDKEEAFWAMNMSDPKNPVRFHPTDSYNPEGK